MMSGRARIVAIIEFVVLASALFCDPKSGTCSISPGITVHRPLEEECLLREDVVFHVSISRFEFPQDGHAVMYINGQEVAKFQQSPVHLSFPPESRLPLGDYTLGIGLVDPQGNAVRPVVEKSFHIVSADYFRRLMDTPPDLASVPEDWKEAVAEGTMLFSPKEPTARLMPGIGNGYVGTVIGSQTLHIAGLYNGLGAVGPSHRARIPSTVAVRLGGAQPLGSALDLRSAVYFRRSRVLTRDGHVDVEQRWYAHREVRSLLVMEMELISSANAVAEVTLLDSRLELDPPFASEDIDFRSVPSFDGLLSWDGWTQQSERENGDLFRVSVVTTAVPESVTLAAGEHKSLVFVTAIRTSLDTVDSLEAARQDHKWATDITSNGYSLMSGHVNAWATLWASGIRVSGNVGLGRAINSSLYYILSSTRDDWPFGLSPTDLAGGMYNGHMFWDSEIWIYPNLLLINPAIARSLLAYRSQRLEGALAKAARMGQSGAMFPWESAYTGDETCPLSSQQNSDMQIHVNGDIVFAFRQYWWATQDLQWLREEAFSLLSSVADFWSGRATRDSSGMYHINNVVAPDEYAINVHDSVYTNVVARMSLQFAAEAATILGYSVPEYWTEIGERLVVPFDQTAQRHVEFEGYAGQRIKQADVILLGYPLMHDMPDQIRANDLQYYAPRVDPNGPAMTWAMHAVGWLETGNMDEANKMVEKTSNNLLAPYGVWCELPMTLYEGGVINFITGAGGFLQTYFFGFPGLRLLNGRLHFKGTGPLLPPGALSYSLHNIHFVGRQLTIEYTASQIKLSVASPGNPLSVSVTNCDSGSTVQSYVLRSDSDLLFERTCFVIGI